MVLFGELFGERGVENSKVVDFCGACVVRWWCEVEATCLLVLLVFVLLVEFRFEGVFVEIGSGWRKGRW
jgi:hypothetical protein